MKEDIFTPEFLKEIGFVLVSLKKSDDTKDKFYGHAMDEATQGMTVLYWNTEGHSCTYFGEDLEPNTSFRIGKDADTWTAFNGYVFNQDDVRRILNLTW